jgi:glucose-6-phosphate isomerase
MAIKFDYSNALPFMQEHEVDYFKDFVKTAHELLHEK